MARPKSIRINITNTEKQLKSQRFHQVKDLGYKSGVVEQAKSDYFLLGKVLINVQKNVIEKGLLKRLNNVADINKKQGEKQLKYHPNLMMKAPSLKSIRDEEIFNQ